MVWLTLHAWLQRQGLALATIPGVGDERQRAWLAEAPPVAQCQAKNGADKLVAHIGIGVIYAVLTHRRPYELPPAYRLGVIEPREPAEESSTTAA